MCLCLVQQTSVLPLCGIQHRNIIFPILKLKSCHTQCYTWHLFVVCNVVYHTPVIGLHVNMCLCLVQQKSVLPLCGIQHRHIVFPILKLKSCHTQCYTWHLFVVCNVVYHTPVVGLHMCLCLVQQMSVLPLCGIQHASVIPIVVYIIIVAYCQLRVRKALTPFNNVQSRTRRELTPFNNVALKAKRLLWLHKLYGDSALLVLNGTLLNRVNALLALDWNDRQIYTSCRRQ